MFPFNPLWIYIVVPVVLVSILVLIRLWQKKMDKRVEIAFTEEEEEKGVQPSKEATTREDQVEVKETRAKPKFSEETKAPECPHYLGYLYMKKGPDSTYIPNECYGCRKLLQCLYSPQVVEKVYGEESQL